MTDSGEPRTHQITTGRCEGGAWIAAAPVQPPSARGEQSYELLLQITVSQSSDHSELEEGCQFSLRLETVGSSGG